MSIRRLAPGEVRGIAPSLVEVYAAAFSCPPYRGADPASFAASLERHAAKPGFAAVVAEEASGLVGFAYGYTSRAGGWWHDRVRSGLGKEPAAVWLDRPFEVVELAVHPALQGRGIGGGLHDRLLAEAAANHRRAVLSTLEAETPAMHLYRRRGWQVLLDGFRFGSDERYRILGRRLTPASRAEADRCLIRPAAGGDLEGIRAVAWGTWAETYARLIPTALQHRLLGTWYAPEALRAALARGQGPFLVAEEAGALCGFIEMDMIGPGLAELTRAYVLPPYQRVGLGSRLYRAALRTLRRTAIPLRSVEVRVEEGNRKGRSFYEKLGFRLVDRVEHDLPEGGRLATVRYRVDLP